jgi:hypothetical protein
MIIWGGCGFIVPDVSQYRLGVEAVRVEAE